MTPAHIAKFSWIIRPYVKQIIPNFAIDFAFSSNILDMNDELFIIRRIMLNSFTTEFAVSSIWNFFGMNPSFKIPIGILGFYRVMRIILRSSMETPDFSAA